MSALVVEDLRVPTGRSLFEELFRWLGLTTRPDAAAELDGPADRVFGQQTYELTRAAWAAPNVQSLRQAFDEIGLSPECVTFEIGMIRASVPSPQAGDRSALRAPSWVVARLGRPASELLVEALEAALAVITANRDTFESHRAWAHADPNPADIARFRHALALGDLLPPSIAQVVLSNLRGEAALLWLVGAVSGNEQPPEWKAVAAGEIALEGMKALQRIVGINFQSEAEAYASYKAATFARLGGASPVNDDEGDDEEESDESPSS